jgi:hypothetical protein
MLGAADQVAEEAPESDDPEHYEGTFKPKPKNAGPDGWTDEELKQALRNR